MRQTVRLYDEQSALLAVEALAWQDGIVCPHCHGTSRVGRLNGLSCPPGTWKCYDCRKPFSARHGTIFQNSHVPVHVWLQALCLLLANDQHLNAHKLGHILGVSVRTAGHLKAKIAAGLIAKAGSSAAYPEAASVPNIGISLREDEVPPQPGQAIYRARYQRFLTALDSLGKPFNEADFLDALSRLIRGSTKIAPKTSESRGEKQLELNLFDQQASKDDGALGKRRSSPQTLAT